MSYILCLDFRGTHDWALCSKVNCEVRMVPGNCTCLNKNQYHTCNLPTSRVLLFRPVLLQPLSRLWVCQYGCCTKRTNVQREERWTDHILSIVHNIIDTQWYLSVQLDFWNGDIFTKKQYFVGCMILFFFICWTIYSLGVLSARTAPNTRLI